MNSINLATLMLTVFKTKVSAAESYADKVLGYAPTVFYRFNETTAEPTAPTTLTDYSGNGINGDYWYDPTLNLAQSTFVDGSPVPLLGPFAGPNYTGAYSWQLSSQNQFSWTGTWGLWFRIPDDYKGVEFAGSLFRFEHYTVDEGQNPDPTVAGIRLYRLSSTEVQLVIDRGAQKTANFTYAPDTWYFAVVTMNDTEAKFYINGVLQATLTDYGTNVVIPLDVDWDWIGNHNINAEFANFIYWKDTILTAEQIADLATV